jgi:8-oxo-dGTP diphosphatase
MSLPNYWEYPGGKINEGEIPQNALVREIKEELGCLITVGEKVEEVNHEYVNIIVHLVTYKAHIKSGMPEALEHAELKWFQLKHLLGLQWAPADIPIVRLLSS